MLMLWSPEYFTRLWCCFEIGVFLDIGSVEHAKQLEIIPLFEPAQAFITAAFCFLYTLIYFLLPPISLASSIFVAPLLGLFLGLVPMHALRRQVMARMQFHRQISTFSLAQAQCSVESDRLLVVAMLDALYSRASSQPQLPQQPQPQLPQQPQPQLPQLPQLPQPQPQPQLQPHPHPQPQPQPQPQPHTGTSTDSSTDSSTGTGTGRFENVLQTKVARAVTAAGFASIAPTRRLLALVGTAIMISFYDSVSTLALVTDAEWMAAGLGSSGARLWYGFAHVFYAAAVAWTLVWTLTYALNFLVVLFPPGSTRCAEWAIDAACIVLLAVLGTLGFAANRAGKEQARDRPWLCIVICVATAGTQLAVGLLASHVSLARSPLAISLNRALSDETVGRGVSVTVRASGLPAEGQGPQAVEAV